MVVQAEMVKLNSNLSFSISQSLLDCYKVVVSLPVSVDYVVTITPDTEYSNIITGSDSYRLHGCPPSIRAERLHGSLSMVTTTPYGRPKEQ